MRKLLLIALAAVAFTSCKKEDKQCWSCSLTGGTAPYYEYCGDINDYHPRDAQGNELNYMCTPK